MPVLAKYLRKLRSVTADELRVRGSQKLRALGERLGGSSLTKLPDDQSFSTLLDSSKIESHAFSSTNFLNHFRTRSEPVFFPAFSNNLTTVAQLRRRWPASEAEIVAEAERILEGRFSLLGFRDLSFGDPIDWHLEPLSGKRTPQDHWSRLNYLDPNVAGDKKITWELNRHQYFMTLGRAYWLTGDERFAAAFVKHLESWMDQNPPKQGINWASSLEISFRLISWIWAFYFFQNSPTLKPEVFLRAMKFLYLHARHLETYLSTYFSPNTHLTGEALGLFYVGTLFPEFKEAERWKEIGRNILLRELSNHVRPDGVYFEQSSYYHRYTTDFYIHFLILSRINGELVAEVDDRLQSLLDHLMYITRPDGTTPLYGDDDGGRVARLDQVAANDFRPVLATGAVLFGRPDYRFVAAKAAEETLWLLGLPGLESFDAIEPREPSKTSVAFESGGYYVMRDGWSPQANYLFFDCGPHGALSYGHAHADALSFEVAVNGRTLLIDPGTYTYTGSKEMRDWFRSSAAHNTLTVDKESSSLVDGAFSWQRVAKCKSAKWMSNERLDYVKGSCEGFPRLPQTTIHTRSILFLKNHYWIVKDQVQTGAGHRADIWFHFDRSAKPLIETAANKSPFITESDNPNSAIIFAFGLDGRWRREEGWVSHCYGEKAPGRVYAFSIPTSGQNEIVTFVLPQRTGVAKQSVAETEAIGGKAFEVTHVNGLDVVMIRNETGGPRVEMKRLASDFDWTWVSFSSEEKTLPTEIVLLGGTSLEFEGRQVFQAAERIEYLRATLVGDQFRVETNRGVLDAGWPVADFAAALSGEKSQF